MKNKSSVYTKDSKATRQPFSAEKIIFGIFLSVSLLMLAIAAVAVVSTARALSREIETLGTVIELVERTDSQGQVYYYPVIRFELQNGGTQDVQLSEGSWPAAYQSGQLVTVRYDPGQPLKARIQSSGSTLSRYLVALITGSLGVAFALGTLLVRWIIRVAPAESEFEKLERE